MISNGAMNGAANGHFMNGRGEYWSQQATPRLIDPNTNRPFDRFDQWGLRDPGGPESPFALPHAVQFSTILTTGWKVYISRRYDNAYKQSQREAVDMANNDCFLMGIVNERRHATAGLSWRIEVDDELDGVERSLKNSFTKIVKNFPFWDQFTYSMMLNIWYGRMASQVVWKWQEMNLPDPAEAMPTTSIPGLPPSSPSKTPKHWRKVAVIDRHQPVNGDSIIHHFDGTPGVLLHMPTEVQGGEKVWGDKGAALLLRGSWRDRFFMFMHEPWAGDFFDADSAEAIHGLGIRHFIYWMNFMRQEWLTNVADWCERTGLGVRLWYYQGGNAKSKEEVWTAARTQSDRTNILIPRYGDGNRAVEGVEYVDTASTGAELLLKLWRHLEDIIERYIIGQKMSGGTDDSGIGGSGVSEFAWDTKRQIVKHDANNFSDHFTQEYIKRVLGWSFPIYRSIPIRFRFNVDQPDAAKYFQAVSSFISLGGEVREAEARSVIPGAGEPQEGDKVLKRQEPPAVGGGPGTGGNDLMSLLAPSSPEAKESGKDLDLDGPLDVEKGGGPPQDKLGEDDENVLQKQKAGPVLQYMNTEHAQGTGVTSTGKPMRPGEFTSKGNLGTPEANAQATAAGQQSLGQQQQNMMGKPGNAPVPGSNKGQGQKGAGQAEAMQPPMVGLAMHHMQMQPLIQQGFAQSTTPQAKDQVHDHWVGVHKDRVMDLYHGVKKDIGGEVPDQFKDTLNSAHKEFRMAMKAMKIGLPTDLNQVMQMHNAKIDAEARHLLAGGQMGQPLGVGGDVTKGMYDLEKLASERDEAEKAFRKAQATHSDLSKRGVTDIRMTVAENDLHNSGVAHNRASLRHSVASRPNDFAWRGEDWHKEHVGDLPKKEVGQAKSPAPEPTPTTLKAGRGGSQLGHGIYATTSEDIAKSYSEGHAPLKIGSPQIKPGTKPSVTEFSIHDDAKIFDHNENHDDLFKELVKDSSFKKAWDEEFGNDAEPSGRNLWDAGSKAMGMGKFKELLQSKGFHGASHGNYGGSKDFSIWDDSVLRGAGEGKTKLYRGTQEPTPAQSPQPGKPETHNFVPSEGPHASVDAAHAQIDHLYKNALDPKLDYKGIKDEVQKLASMSKDDVLAVAKKFGINQSLSSKKAALEQIERKVSQRRESFERTNFRPEDDAASKAKAALGSNSPSQERTPAQDIESIRQARSGNKQDGNRSHEQMLSDYNIAAKKHIDENEEMYGERSEEIKATIAANPKIAAAEKKYEERGKIVDKHIASANLPEHLGKYYGQIAKEVIGSMPDGAYERFMGGHVKINFHGYGQSMKDKWNNQHAVNALQKIGTNQAIGGFYDSNNGEIDINGGGELSKEFGEDKRMTTRELYVHEMFHAVDGVKFELSSSDEWKRAWEEEIKSPKRVTLYASTDACEGFAEFGRMVFGAGYNQDKHQEYQEAFPKCYAIFKKHGLVHGERPW